MMIRGVIKKQWAPFLVVVVVGVFLGGLAGIGGSLMTLAAVTAVALLFVLTRSPVFGLLLVLFFLPLERIGAYESFVGTIRISQVIALVAMVVWGFQTVLRRVRLRPNPVALPLAIFCALSIVGISQAPNVQRSVVVVALVVFTILVALIIPQLITTRKNLFRVVTVLLISATLVSIFGLFQFIGDTIGLPTSVTGLRDLYTKDVFGFPRIQSTTLEPLYFANYLLLPIGVVFALFLARRSIIPRWLIVTLCVLFFANMILTVSRGGYLGLLALVLCVAVCAYRDLFRIRTLVPLFIGAAIVLVVVFRALSYGDPAGMNVETFSTHIQNVFWGASFNERVETIEIAKQAFWSSPMFGIGPGSFGPYAAQSPLLQPADGWRIVNNEPLEILTEHGILGFCAMLATVLILFVRSVKALRYRKDQALWYLHLGFAGAAVGMLVQYQTFSTLYIMHIWVTIGLLVAAQNLLLLGEKQ